MQRLAWTGGILIYVLFLIASAPASALFWALSFGPLKITAASTSGTLWNGKAQGIAVSAKSRQALLIGDSVWTLHPLSLFLGKLSLDLSFSGASAGRASIVLGTSNVRLQQTDLSFPATVLSYAQSGNTLPPLQGMAHIRIQDLLLQTDNYHGQGECNWSQAGIALNKTHQLGELHLSASATGKDIKLDLQSGPGSPLNIRGTGNWSKTAGLAFNGSARTSTRESDLEALLGLIGQKQPDGTYAIKLSPSSAKRLDSAAHPPL